LVNIRSSYLSKFYWKLKQLRGAKKAVIALSRKILVIIYHLLKKSEAYDESKFDVIRERQEANRLKRIISEAEKLGYVLKAI